MSPTSISVSWKHEHETFFHSTEKYNISYRGVNHSNTHSYTPTPKPNPCRSISKVAQIRNFHATCIIISRLVLANSRLEIKCFFFYREVERERERKKKRKTFPHALASPAVLTKEYRNVRLFQTKKGEHPSTDSPLRGEVFRGSLNSASEIKTTTSSRHQGPRIGKELI